MLLRFALLKIFTLALLLLLVLFILPKTIYAGKNVDISLANQTLSTYQDGKLLNTFLISSGKWSPTPTGTFYPWAKLPSTRMTGGDKKLGTYYDLPNVPYVVYFYQGYAIHGAYWHNNFGTPMSHGCVNMRPADAKIVYNWIEMSTPITIH
jgi:lipoprotein-anchoring transpeptidase ErfK/SrfK